MSDGILMNLLSAVALAPEGQLSEGWRDRAEKLYDGKPSDDEIKEFFVELYNKSCCESSDFIKATVNPEFTSNY